MLSKIREILSAAAIHYGWVMEPDAKNILQLAGIDVPVSCWAKTPEEALAFAAKQGYPLAMKVVSPQILHKSDVGGVIVGINTNESLLAGFEKMTRLQGFAGVLIEEMLQGIELIVGAKIDFQFGPVVMLGIGGVSVEIYQDTVIRMAPVARNDVESMVAHLKARTLLEGFRGAKPINLAALTNLMIIFSQLVTDLSDDIESIDLNPVLCNEERCVAADARIILPSSRT
ncbi:MAG: acetate--CoA ligase family protein [Proteobacteria bacterium]|nr:acetate--CoA ligase family protein [Pseudomonadota bacterium]MBU1233968.1 acetate--CoA ligase family protein [Pseudomonadota bacterium]MBU1419673.1 acetate--CoA ligase family protein [Pseudomonadota bacterium]MBU1454129.1 acetate--CoA ligase family protein [Pseudomonadota bacterium]